MHDADKEDRTATGLMLAKCDKCYEEANKKPRLKDGTEIQSGDFIDNGIDVFYVENVSPTDATLHNVGNKLAFTNSWIYSFALTKDIQKRTCEEIATYSRHEAIKAEKLQEALEMEMRIYSKICKAANKQKEQNNE
jgi:hypothetical protein